VTPAPHPAAIGNSKSRTLQDVRLQASGPNSQLPRYAAMMRRLQRARMNVETGKIKQTLVRRRPQLPPPHRKAAGRAGRALTAAYGKTVKLYRVHSAVVKLQGL
jgi:hypothetical protein